MVFAATRFQNIGVAAFFFKICSQTNVLEAYSFKYPVFYDSEDRFSKGRFLLLLAVVLVVVVLVLVVLGSGSGCFGCGSGCLGCLLGCGCGSEFPKGRPSYSASSGGCSGGGCSGCCCFWILDLVASDVVLVVSVVFWVVVAVVVALLVDCAPCLLQREHN